MSKEREVLLERLPEADAGVEDYVLLFHARRDGALGPPVEEVAHLTHHVVVAGVALHGLRLTEHVHQNYGAPRLSHHVGHAGVSAQRADVVHDAGPGLEGSLGSTS